PNRNNFQICSVPQLKRWLLTWVPVLSWLPRYSIREDGLGDLIAGISVGIMHLPQGMAYALLASVPPVYGLYTSFYPVLIYFIFGTSRHVSIGTFAVISMMIGSVTERLAPDAHFLVNGTNSSSGFYINEAARDTYRVQVATASTLLTGAFQVVLGMMRFGFVGTYLSEPLVRGYTTGAAAHVVISQLKYLFGVSPQRHNGPLELIYTLVDVCALLPQTSVPTLVISVVSLAVLILVKEINSIYSRKLPLPIPIELLVIIAATLTSYYIHLGDIHQVQVVGEIPSGLLPPAMPDRGLFSSLVGDAFAVAVVSYAISISLGKTFALKYGYKVDNNQELVALGLSNTVGGFFHCYSVTSSMSRSLVQESTGGKTQMAGAISAVIVLITVLKLGALFEELPKAVLSTIVFVNLKGMFKQCADLPLLWKTNRVDLLVWVVTFACTLLLNLDVGLAVSVTFSLLTVILRTQRPKYYVLGWLPGTELYVDAQTYAEILGITIFRCSSFLYHANAELYRQALEEKSGINVNKLLKHKRKRIAKEKREAQKNRKSKQLRNNAMVVIPTNQPAFSVNKETEFARQCGSDPCTDSASVGQSECVANGNVNWGFQDEEDTCATSTRIHMSSQSSTHSVILDLSTVGFVDTVTLKMLKNVREQISVCVCVCVCVSVCVVQHLEQGGFFSEGVCKSKVFPTIHDAVLHCLMLKGRELPSHQPIQVKISHTVANSG
uniref:STAS domain-containing protein n=1 Tax=Denticeps clupeoides TaxID=299321 RepID=A0AAY4CKA5_9TELE